MTNTVQVNWSELSPVWIFMMQMGIILLAMLIANIIRLRIPAIKKMLLPTSLIAGVLVFAAKSLLGLTGAPLIDTLFDNATMQIITYHAMGIGFSAIALKLSRRPKDIRFDKLLDNSMINAGSYMLQASVGLLVTLVLFPAIGFAGIILPLGYGQGPGNAMIWGGNYEAYGLSGGASFGLTIATMGFVSASVVGVIYMNIMKHKGKLTVRTHTKAEITADTAEVEVDESSAEAESVDRLTVNLALVALVYGLAYLFMHVLSLFGIKLINDLAWGLNFMWAVLFGMVIKTLLGVFSRKKIIRSEYRSNYLLDRISGLAFEIMMVSGMAAIEWESVAKYWLPLTVLSVAGAAVTFVYIYFASKATSRGHEHETFLCNYGTLTGTISNGMILLREIDPDYVTPASNNVVFANALNTIFNAPLFLLLASVPGGLLGLQGKACTWVCWGLFSLLFVIYAVVVFRRQIFRKKYKGKIEHWTEENGYTPIEPIEKE